MIISNKLLKHIRKMFYASFLNIKHRDEPDFVKSRLVAELDNMDMITMSAMAIMLSETNAKASSPYISSLKKADIKEALLAFLIDSYYATNIKQLEELFNKTYYKRKIGKYLRKVVIFVKRGISDTLPKRNMWFITRMRVSSKQTKAYIEKICETINTFESVKYISALSGNVESSNSKRNYKLDHLSDSYKDALIYLVDFLLTCTCISKMLFVERMIAKIPAGSEYTRIIENLTGSIKNHNLVINKSRPVYNQFYKSELGGISGDDYLYGMAVTVMVNNIQKTEPPDLGLLELDYAPGDFLKLINNMRQWLDRLAVDDSAKDSGSLILQRITMLVKGNFNLLIDTLGELLNLERFYSERVTYYIRERDKQRYLEGDLNKEILELSSPGQEHPNTEPRSYK